VLDILQNKYETPIKRTAENVIISLHGEELPTSLTLSELKTKYDYTEADRVEITERPVPANSRSAEADRVEITERSVSANPRSVLVAAPVQKKESDYRKMMSQGGFSFNKAMIDILVQAQLITRELGESILHIAMLENQSVVQILIQESYLKEKDILATASRVLSIESVDLEGMQISPEILSHVPKHVAEYYCILPIRREGHRLCVAISNPFEKTKLEELQMVTGSDIFPVLSTEISIKNKIQVLYHQNQEDWKKTYLIEQPKEIFQEKHQQVIIKDGKKLNLHEVNFAECEEPTIWTDKNESFEEPLPKVFDDKTMDPRTKDSNKLIIKDGKRITADEMSDDECNMATLWSDRSDDVDMPEEEGGINFDDLYPSFESWKKLKSTDHEPTQPFSSDEIMTAIPMDNSNETSSIGWDFSGGDIPVLAGLDPDQIPEAVEISIDSLQQNFPSQPEISIPEEKKQDFFYSTPEIPSSLFHFDNDTKISEEEQRLESALRGNKLDNLLSTDPSVISFDISDLGFSDTIPALTTNQESLYDIYQENKNQDSKETISKTTIPEHQATSTKNYEQEQDPKAVLDTPDEISSHEKQTPADREESVSTKDESDHLSKPSTIISPDSESSISPESPVTISPDSESIMSPESPVTISPDSESSITPESSVTISPDSESSITPESSVTISPDSELSPELKEDLSSDNSQETLQKELDIVDQIAQSEKISTAHPAIQPEDYTREFMKKSLHNMFHDQPEKEESSEKPKKSNDESLQEQQDVKKQQDIQEQQEEKKDNKETIVDYYSKMYLHKVYPCHIYVSRDKIFSMPEKNKKQQTEQSISKNDSYITVHPHFPGCITVPQQLRIEIRPTYTKGTFWITPVALEKIKDAHIEICYGNNTIQTIETPITITKQTKAFVSILLGVLIPICSFLYHLYSKTPEERENILAPLFSMVDNILEFTGGIVPLGLYIGIVFFLIGIVLFFLKRPKIKQIMD